MSNLQEITDAIDGRLIELKQQIASLEAARRALTEIRGSRPAGQPAEVTPPAKPARRRRSRAPAASAPTPSKSSPSSAAGPAVETAPKARTTKSPPKARTTKSSPKARRRDLDPGQIEGLLRDSEDGLSLVALTRRTGVSEAKVADRLGTLERSGEVRRSGPRRTSLWRLVTDEERIAERVAELARASQPKA